MSRPSEEALAITSPVVASRSAMGVPPPACHRCARKLSNCMASSSQDTCAVSSAVEPRRPLLHERRHALGVIGGVPELLLIIALDIELLLERAARALEHGLFGPRQAAGRGGRQLPGERIDLRSELTVRDAAPDEAPLRGLLGRKLLAEKSEPQRARRAHEPR